MSKVLVTSDLHLSEKIWKHRPIERDSYYSWEQIVDIAIYEQCSDIILAGDILDKQTNTSNPLHSLLLGLNRLTDAGISIHYNQGQHEYQLSPWMDLHRQARHFDGVELHKIGGLSWCGSDYAQPDKLAAFLSSEAVRNASVLVCHQVWLEFMGEECKPQGSFADIPENVKYLITGDYHDNICQKFGNLVVMSPGSTHLRSISEPENKYVFILEIENEKVKISTRELYTRRRIEIDATKNPDLSTVLNRIDQGLAAAADYAEEVGLDEQIQMPLLRLIYCQDDTELAGHVEKAVSGRAHLFYKQVKSEGKSDEPSLTEHMDASDRITLLGCLDHYVDAKEKPSVYQLAHRLLDSKDPDQALLQWVKENT